MAVPSFTRSVHEQREREHRRFGDGGRSAPYPGEARCPLCLAVTNSVLPLLAATFEPAARSATETPLVDACSWCADHLQAYEAGQSRLLTTISDYVCGLGATAASLAASRDGADGLLTALQTLHAARSPSTPLERRDAYARTRLPAELLSVLLHSWRSVAVSLGAAASEWRLYQVPSLQLRASLAVQLRALAFNPALMQEALSLEYSRVPDAELLPGARSLLLGTQLADLMAALLSGARLTSEQAELLGGELSVELFPSAKHSVGAEVGTFGSLLECDLPLVLLLLTETFPHNSAAETASQARLFALAALGQALLRSCLPRHQDLRRNNSSSRCDPEHAAGSHPVSLEWWPSDADPAGGELQALLQLRVMLASAANVQLPLDSSHALVEVRTSLEQYAALAGLLLEARVGSEPRESISPLGVPSASEVLGCAGALGLLQRWAAATATLSGSASERAVFPPMSSTSPLQLQRMPHDFAALTAELYDRRCASCGMPPVEPALCLLCGTLLCAGPNCRRNRELGPAEPTGGQCTRHARECGSGIGLYYLVHQGRTLLVDGPHSAYYSSLYLDAHGEEDRGLRRGKPLYLSQERVEGAHKLWLAHALPIKVSRTRQAASVPETIPDNHF